MAVVAEMRTIVHMAGEDGGSSIKGRVSLAARRLGLSYSEAHRLWYGQRKEIGAHEADVGKPGRTGKCSGKDATPFSLAQLYADLRSAMHAIGM